MFGKGKRFSTFCPMGETKGLGIILFTNWGKGVSAAGTILVFVQPVPLVFVRYCWKMKTFWLFVVS